MAVLIERTRELAAIEAVIERGGVLVVEGSAGIGKTSLLAAASDQAAALDREVLMATGSHLESGFAFGVVRQLIERRLAAATEDERDALLAGPAAAVRRLLSVQSESEPASDVSFAMLHGLYWVIANLSTRQPVVLIVDDAHWADAPSQRFLAYLASRVAGLDVAMLIGLRAEPPGAQDVAISEVLARAAVVRPELLSERGIRAVAQHSLGADATDGLCAALRDASGGNPFYVMELLRAVAADGQLQPGGTDAVTAHVVARIRRLDPGALALAQALAILGDQCELRHGAAVAEVDVATATRWAGALVRADVLADVNPPRFIHPIARDATEASLTSEDLDATHRAAARVLFAERVSPGQVAAHLVELQPADDPWVTDRLRDAARDAMESGAPATAIVLLERARQEPPPSADRIDVLRELARAEVRAGRDTAYRRFAEALELTQDARLRAEIALEIAEAYAGLFRWMDAVDAIERALLDVGDRDPHLADRLEGELVVAGLHDARAASRVAPALARLTARELTGAPAEARAVAIGMGRLLAGRPADEIASVLEECLANGAAHVSNWDTRAALLWSLTTAERFATVESALEPMLQQAHRSGSARALIATYSTLGLLELRRGALPEADAAARVALRVLREGDFAPGLAFGATVLADVAVEAGELDEAAALLAPLPRDDLAPGVGTVLIPAARGRLCIAQGRPHDAIGEFERCIAMFSTDAWGIEVHDVGYLHARSGAAHARWLLGERERAVAQAESELADVRQFGASRALGVSTRITGLVAGGGNGLHLLHESVDVLRASAATLELAKSLVELGAALRRTSQRTRARNLLAEGLDLAARCGARPLATRAREELLATGARPRREWRRGVEALTPSELRVARLASSGRTNRQIAQGLYVTLKTVEGHLARTYQKLGISGRAELARTLTDEKPGCLPAGDEGADE